MQKPEPEKGTGVPMDGIESHWTRQEGKKSQAELRSALEVTTIWASQQGWLKRDGQWGRKKTKTKHGRADARKVSSRWKGPLCQCYWKGKDAKKKNNVSCIIQQHSLLVTLTGAGAARGVWWGQRSNWSGQGIRWEREGSKHSHLKKLSIYSHACLGMQSVSQHAHPVTKS